MREKLKDMCETIESDYPEGECGKEELDDLVTDLYLLLEETIRYLEEQCQL